MRRRAFLAALPLLATRVGGAERGPGSRTDRENALVFPRDHGAHPAYRTEWWYATGHLASDAGPLGFQVTFFRFRRNVDPAITSRFAPRQIIVAHAAIADPRDGRLATAGIAARGGVGDALAGTGDTDVRIARWSLARDPATGAYRADADASASPSAFAFALTLKPTQPILLHGDAGVSRKGPDPVHTSRYYSQPQLSVAGDLVRHGRRIAVHGTGWLDHEWAQDFIDHRAAGWDWVGINFDDGDTLMAFRVRSRIAGAPVLWASATRRSRDGRTQTFGPDEVGFDVQRQWTSPRTSARYPVVFRLRVGDANFTISPLVDDQELDTRTTTGIVYWEGAATAARDGAIIGRGYLELTGYAAPMVL